MIYIRLISPEFADYLRIGFVDRIGGEERLLKFFDAKLLSLAPSQTLGRLAHCELTPSS